MQKIDSTIVIVKNVIVIGMKEMLRNGGSNKYTYGKW